MDKICRLCFSVTDQVSCKLTEDSEIMYKLNCLSLELSLTEPFPKQICDLCHRKIEDIHEFHAYVMQNERKLKQYLNNNSLNSFYSQLTNDTEIKHERTPKRNPVVKEEEESQDSNHFDVASYVPPHISLEIQRIKSDSENDADKNDKPIKTAKIKPKPKERVKQPSNTKTRAPKVNRKVIRKDKFAEHEPNKCLTCFKLCDSSLNLSKHYKNQHSIEPDSLKPENDIDVTDKYTTHKLDDRIAYYKCNSCGDSNNDVREIVKHVILHLYERPFVCKLCGKTYKTVYEIVRHGRVHSGFKLFCHYGCGYSSPYPGALRDHEKRHTDERNYTCKTCGKGFLVKTWYEQHQNIHNNVKPFVCDFCGMAFHMHRYLVTHRNKRHPGLSAIRKYTCTQCSFTCDNKNGLTTHLEQHTENPAEAKLTLLCDLCGKGFARTDHLTNHKNGKHYGIKPHSCNVCNKQFQKKFNLTVHEKIHTGEGRHLCLYCGKFYAQKSTLHRHQKKRHPEHYDRIKNPRPTE